LYRYAPLGSRMRLLATPGCGHGLMGPVPDPGRRWVYLTEGPWDGAALWEACAIAKPGPRGGLMLTANAGVSLLSNANVLAVPGAGTFNEKWLPLFEGKSVAIFYDNDHPKAHPQTGAVVAPAGYEGMRRVAGVLGSAGGALTVHYLAWGGAAPATHDPGLASGYDVRDWLTTPDVDGERTATLQRVRRLEGLIKLVRPIPSDWLPGRAPDVAEGGGTGMACLPCDSWKTLVTAWRKALKWTDGLDRALACMLSTILSTKALGDQLWFKVVGPAACGKSTLCEAVSVSPHVLAKSTMRGFHSGFRSDKDGTEDNSLLVLARDKTLVTKDGDTLLKAPNLSQILSEARDIYDRTSRTHYRNRMGRDYEGVNMTWILCGTSSLAALDASELGERFLTCRVMEAIDEGLENEILWRVANRAQRAMSYEANGRAEGQHDPDLVLAMQLTGGYIGYLRDNAQALLDKVRLPEGRLRLCMRLGQFVAYMRARPSKFQEEEAERELASRLTSQMVRLAMCLAVVTNRGLADDGVMARVRAVALDTARGTTMEICRRLYEAGPDGMDIKALYLYVSEKESKVRELLRFLRTIGAAEVHTKRIAAGVTSRPRWRLTGRLAALWKEAGADGQPE
jgi:hypothetical protein